MARLKPSSPAWQPGQSGNPAGRPIGNRNKLNEKFILALHDDFVQHGAKVIEQVRKDKPDIYLKVIASIPSARAARERWVRVRWDEQ